MKTKSEAAGSKAGTAGKAAKAPEKKPAAPATVDVETGIRLDRVKPDVVDRYLKQFGLGTEGPIGDRLKRLAGWLMERVDKKKRAVCGTCGGRSDARLAACPFCGDEETDQKVDEAAAIAELRGAAAHPLSTAEPASKVEAKPAAAPKAEKAPPAGKGPKAAPAPAAPASSAAPTGAGFGAWVSGAPAPASAPAAGPKAASAMVVAGEGPAGTSADLDASVARCRTLHEAAVGNIYDLGGELRRIFTEKLFLRRAAPETGVPVYESWTAFVATELEDVCTVQYSYTLMQIVRAFPRELVLRHGAKKLSLLLRVKDPDLQHELEGKLATEGMTIEQLQTRVTEAVGTGQASVGRPQIEGGRGVRGQGNLDGRPVELSDAEAAAKRRRGVASGDEEEGKPPSSTISQEDLDGIQQDGLDSLPEPPAGKPKAGAAPVGKAGSTHPFDVPDGKGKKGAVPPAPVAPPAEQKMCTVTLEYGKKKHAALARPVKKGAEPKQAKRLADDPWFEEELPNGVRLVVKMVAGKKGIEFIREFLPAKDSK